MLYAHWIIPHEDHSLLSSRPRYSSGTTIMERINMPLPSISKLIEGTFITGLKWSWWRSEEREKEEMTDCWKAFVTWARWSSTRLFDEWVSFRTTCKLIYESSGTGTVISQFSTIVPSDFVASPMWLKRWKKHNISLCHGTIAVTVQRSHTQW